MVNTNADGSRANCVSPLREWPASASRAAEFWSGKESEPSREHIVSEHTMYHPARPFVPVRTMLAYNPTSVI
jgi:hypothetical protein